MASAPIISDSPIVVSEAKAHTRKNRRRRGCIGLALTVMLLALIVAVLVFSYFFLPLLDGWVQRASKIVKQIPSWLRPMLFTAYFAYAVTPIGFGYSFCILVSTLLYGWVAIVFVYIGGVMGGVICFRVGALFRSKNCWLPNFIRRLYRSYRVQVEALELTVSEYPFRTIVLLQLSFVPYGVQNVLYRALTDVKIFPFLLACMTSNSLASVLAVWHGIASHQLVEARGNKKTFVSSDVVPFIASTIFSVVSFVVIGGLARVRIAKLAKRERDRKAAEEVHGHEDDEADEKCTTLRP